MNIWFSLAERFDLQFKNTDTMASKLEEQRVFMVALSQGEAILENDEQYAFAAGQVIYYLLHNVAALIQVGIFGVFVVSGIVIEIIGTVNHPNMFMSKTEILHVKWRARIIAAVESSIVIILWIVGNRGMVLYLAMAMITCAALMVLAIGLGQEVKET